MKRGQTILFWVAMIVVAVLLWKMSNSPSPAIPASNAAELQTQIANKSIQSAYINVYPTRTVVTAERRDSARFQASISNQDVPKVIQELEESGVSVSIQGGAEPQNDWQSFLIDGVPFILLVIAFIVFMQRMKAKARKDSDQPRPIDV